MAEYVVGYKVLVYDAPDYVPGGQLLYEQEFRARPEDMQGYRLGEALRRATTNAQSMERTFPGKYVEVDCLWEEGEEIW